MDATREEILSGQAGLDGLRHLLYGRASRAALRRELTALLEPGAQLGACRLERAKFKPDRKLTGYYVASISSTDRRLVRGVEVVWSPGETADGEPPAETSMQDEARAAGVAAPFRALRADGPAFGLHVAPLDVTFPQLVRLSTPDHVRELMSATYARAGDGGVAAAYTVSTMRYRPRQRHVLRYDPVGTAGRTVFAKLYRQGGAERAARVTHAVADRVERAGPGVSAVRPLPAPEADDVAIYPLVPGSPMSRHLWDGPAVAGHLARAGELLRALHDGGDEPGVELRADDLDAQVRATARAAEHLGPLVPGAAAEVGRLLDRVRELGSALPPEPSGFAHGDFKADHVWVARGELTLLDFDTCCLAEPALDVGKFLADLSWWHAVSDRPGLVEAQQQFLRGYGPTSDHRLARARLYETVVLTRIVVRRLRRFEPDWALRTTALVARAAQGLDGVAGQASLSGSAAS